MSQDSNIGALAADLIDDAAETLEQCGWIRNGYRREGEGYCLVGALIRARVDEIGLGLLSAPVIPVGMNRAEELALRAVRGVLPGSAWSVIHEFRLDGDRVIYFNDVQCSGPDEAIETLRRASKALRNGEVGK